MTTKNIFTFLGTFVAGALIALVARAALFNPHDAAPAAPASATQTAAADPHAGHSGHTAATPVASKTKETVKTVNTVCAICGMDVDPSIPPADYKGQKVGFGCAACPPKFARNPDKWGPAALKNQVVEN